MGPLNRGWQTTRPCCYGYIHLQTHTHTHTHTETLLMEVSKTFFTNWYDYLRTFGACLQKDYLLGTVTVKQPIKGKGEASLPSSEMEDEKNKCSIPVWIYNADRLTVKSTKKRWFFSPTQLFTQGQWWSILRMQRLQMLRGGREKHPLYTPTCHNAVNFIPQVLKLQPE